MVVTINVLNTKSLSGNWKLVQVGVVCDWGRAFFSLMKGAIVEQGAKTYFTAELDFKEIYK